MNRSRGPSKALLALAMAGLIGWSAQSARAENPNNIYTIYRGLSGNLTDPSNPPLIVPSNPAVNVAPGFRAGMALNPGHVGQWLWSTYYDVRNVTNPVTSASDTQDTNIQILNNNPNNPADPDYNPHGGLVARVRFRESKTSQEILDFDIVLSCGEVWTAKISIPTPTSVPVVTSNDPIRLTGTLSSTTFTSGPSASLAAGRPVAVPTGISIDDVQRGYFEVIAEEALNCEPDGGTLDPTAVETWTRLGAGPLDPLRTPSNALAAEEIIIRVAAGVSYTFNLDAISRFVILGAGSIWAPPGTGAPDISDCVGPDNTAADTAVPPGVTYTGLPHCQDQMNFALSKYRLTPQFDIDPAVGGSTHVVINLPTKHVVCPVSSGHYQGTPHPPFSCEGTGSPAPSGAGGEAIGCLPYNRIEDFPFSSDIFSPGTTNICKLPREVTIFGIENGTVADPRADEQIDVSSIPRQHLSGWVDFNLFEDPTNPIQVHQQTGLNPALVDFLATGFVGYKGLPALSLILQEYSNGNVTGVYGNSVPPPYEVWLLKPGQS